MPKIQINASRHGTPGEVVAVEDGLVVWSGLIEELGDADGFDTHFCHDDDEEWLIRLWRAGNLTPIRDDQRS
jgi:hypothetical protein